MRILHLLASPFWSGPAENVALLALAQREAGHEVTVAVDRKRTQVGAEEPAVPRFEALGLLDAGGLELSVKSSPWRLWKDSRTLRARALDVVHTHFTHDHLLARWFKPKGAVLVRSVHAPRSIRSSLPKADAYTVPASSEVPRLKGHTVRVLPPLVDPLFRPAEDRKRWREDLAVEGAPLVGMVSTFQPSRRHELGIEAFARLLRQHPEARLVLVGDGQLEAPIRQKVAGLGIQERVHFAGYQQGPSFVKWLQALDEVWILGLGNDWSGRAAAQARACGVRVVAVEEGALPSLADVRVAQLTPEAVVEASLSGHKALVAHPSNQRIAQDILALYERLRGAR
ncbi:Glycosyltransferase involved in cell wall bisynthesis [Stigmatella aurantiaca]|uniref:Glycosyltransferase involved in cell wall bisynthesis n=1 Tax=Stigmatella aurantiaca TaxID=41 RepID=A0A1H8ETI4_STIAU|nr:glycosyltransferase [Stigmatella aurantiaca]SEN22762.1 Glycosyltransferase involved in cell wall bisynthesis [Stigmatella aurantiaca]